MSIKRIIHKIIGKSPTEAQKKFLQDHGFRHGKNFCNFSPYAIDANWPWLISIGDDVTISSDVKILAHDASTNKVGARTKIGTVTIGNNVFIGANSLILCNTRIGDNVIIGAASVVTKDIPSNSVVAGNPAKIVCSFDDYKKRHLDNRNSHPIFNQHDWNEWIDAPEDDKMMMKEQLKDTFGYL